MTGKEGQQKSLCVSQRSSIRYEAKRLAATKESFLLLDLFFCRDDFSGVYRFFFFFLRVSNFFFFLGVYQTFSFVVVVLFFFCSPFSCSSEKRSEAPKNPATDCSSELQRLPSHNKKTGTRAFFHIISGWGRKLIYSLSPYQFPPFYLLTPFFRELPMMA